MTESSTSSGPGSPAPPSAADLALIRAVQNREPGAFDRFVERFGAMILAFGMRMCGNRPDAEDVFQETLVKVFTSLAELKRPEALRTWVFRVVANQCLMSRRGPRHPARTIGIEDVHPHSPGGEGPGIPDPQAPDPERLVLENESRRRLEDGLRNLPPAYRIVVLLRDLQGLSTEEVAQVLDISVANVKVRLHRARLALRRFLGATPEAAETGS